MEGFFTQSIKASVALLELRETMQLKIMIPQLDHNQYLTGQIGFHQMNTHHHQMKRRLCAIDLRLLLLSGFPTKMIRMQDLVHHLCSLDHTSQSKKYKEEYLVNSTGTYNKTKCRTQLQKSSKRDCRVIVRSLIINAEWNFSNEMNYQTQIQYESMFSSFYIFLDQFNTTMISFP